MTNSEKLQLYIDTLVPTLEKRVRDTLARIPNSIHHLMAVRGYIRFHDRIAKRWAMTDAEESAFKSSSAYADLERERKAIIKKFGEQNPGIRCAVTLTLAA